MQLISGLPRVENHLRISLFLILIGSFSWIFAGCNGSGGGPGVTPQPPFTFPQPEVRESSGGMLQTTLHARIADNMLVDNFSGENRVVHTPTFEGSIPGPTLSVKPGDTLSIDMVNELPANPPVQRMGFFPHNPYTINLHTHGLEVSPLGISDNIFRQMPPGTTNTVKVDIPANHPSGTYWYHTHVHGTVTFQLISGMAGFLIVKGGAGTLDALPEVAAARDVVMAFQVIRTDLKGNVPFVNQKTTQFGTFPPGTTDPAQQGIWSTYGLDGASGRSFYYYTTNGATNPPLHMRPGEVQRWRLLNATDGDDLLVALQGHGLNIVAMDGITVSNMYRLKIGAPVVMGSGQRVDVLVKAGSPGTYALQALDPATKQSVSPSGIAPDYRLSRHSFDFPTPCSPGTNLVIVPGGFVEDCPPMSPPGKKLSYSFPLATVIVDGTPIEMKLPSGPLPAPTGLPSVATMLKRRPDAVRKVAFEICANIKGTSSSHPGYRLPSCGWYLTKYDAKYWGGTPLNNLMMMRDGDDNGVPSVPFNPNLPLVDFKKEGLFNPDQPLFDDMVVGNYEEWKVVNRSFSDHPFHIHQNHFLVTAINDIPLSQPEWHDTIIVPGSMPQPISPDLGQPNINDNQYPSITFRIYFAPQTVGCFVAHCHTINHEDIGMMQRMDILPGRGQPSGCVVGGM